SGSVASVSYHGQARGLPHAHIAGQPCPHCGPGTLPAFAFTGPPPEESDLPWRPPGIKFPWPPDEYVCDGGDLNADAFVKKDWTVVGLDQEDTIAHYDTLDGRTEISASNCVCIYAPRFAAVRQVSAPIVYEGHERMAGVEKPTRVNLHEETRGTRTPEMTYTYETEGKPCLRLCKIADRSEAKLGETIQFTIRFDNVGEQKIGNVTIIDNLMPRLEYVAGSAQSTLKANFATQEQ